MFLVPPPTPLKKSELVGCPETHTHTHTLSTVALAPPPRLTSSLSLSVLSVQVMQVVREQIMRALTLKPNSLDQFKSRLQNLSYTEILKIRQSERMNQEDFQSRPIL